jgi:hypothetical protein
MGAETRMKFAPLALLMLAALPDPQAPSAMRPDVPDFTIRTRRTFDGPRAVSQTMVLQVKGARQRTVHRFDGPGLPAGDASVHITQCDRRRGVIVNERRRIYAIVPIPAQRGPWRAVAQDTRPIGETVTVDAVDTGERRQIGPFLARHVVTTTTTERGGESRPISTRVQDGWYLDLPSQCESDGAGAAVLTVSSPSERVEVKWKGTARSGWAVTETTRTTEGDQGMNSTTTLVEFSTAPLDPALFDVPRGYRPALPVGNGGFDLEKPDTMLNRVRHVVETAASWVQYTWSRIGSRSRVEVEAREPR